MTRKIVIDARAIQIGKYNGAQRYLEEILQELDKIVEPNRYEVLIRPQFADMLHLKNIGIVKVKADSYIHWLIKWNIYVRKKKGVYGNLSVGPVTYRKSVSTMFDMYPFMNMYAAGKKRYFVMKNIYRVNAWWSGKIVTSSEYSKTQILKHFKSISKKIYVVDNGWEHIKRIKPDHRVLEKFSLPDKKYYFYLGRLAKNKNFSWIFEIADRHPNDIFVISGALSKQSFNFYKGKNENIIYTGFVNDEEMQALYQHCKAFLFPSFEEGFGIPPLEALYNGAPIIISNTSCLPEIYGDSAHYIDPYCYDYDLDEILQQPVAPPEKALMRHSWERAAGQWKELLESYQ